VLVITTGVEDVPVMTNCPPLAMSVLPPEVFTIVPGVIQRTLGVGTDTEQSSTYTDAWDGLQIESEVNAPHTCRGAGRAGVDTVLVTPAAKFGTSSWANTA
jgi:hypothetical protein